MVLWCRTFPKPGLSESSLIIASGPAFLLPDDFLQAGWRKRLLRTLVELRSHARTPKSLGSCLEGTVRVLAPDRVTVRARH
jgi:hypothetical protein